MHATARVVAEATAPGRTRLAVVRSQSPLLLRPTGLVRDRAPDEVAGGAQVHLVGGAAGPLGGDRLRLEIEVGPGAALCMRTVAASIALPGPDGVGSQVEVHATVAAGGSLAWLPEPLVAAASCRHVVRARVTLAEGAELVWRDELVCGRHGEQPGDAMVALAVTYGGQPLYQQELAVGPSAPGWDGPAVLAGARATGSVLYVHPGWAADPPGPVVLSPTAALLPLATGPAAVVTATAPDAATLRHYLDTALTAIPKINSSSGNLLPPAPPNLASSPTLT